MNANRSTQARTSGNQTQAASQPAEQTGQHGNDYFNLHTDGIGYLNDIRWVEPRGRKQDRFLAARVNALRGSVSDPNYTRYDLRVSGEEAIGLIAELQQASEEDRQIFISFRIGDSYADAYMGNEYGADEKPTGRQIPRAVIKGRLLLVKSVKIDGVLWYQRPETDGAGDTIQAGGGSGGEGGDTGGDELPAGQTQAGGGEESPDSTPPAASTEGSSPRMPQPRGTARAPYAPQRSERASGARAAVAA